MITSRSRITAALGGALALVLAGCGGGAASRPSSQPGTPAVAASRSAPPTAEVIGAWMHLHHVTAYTAANDPNHLLGRQGEYTSKINWAHGGSADTNSIEVFPSKASLAKRYQLAKSLQGTLIGDGYDYTDSTALLRLGQAYTPAQAHRLLAAFQAAVGQ